MPKKRMWVTEEEEGEVSYPPDYDVISIPNDFNVNTLYNLIVNGKIQWPTFQRYYVWDIKRASKFIESLIMELPVPDIFLYEEGKNKFSVIDGQQRLSTIYYFKKMRFPLRERVAELRKIFDESGKIPDGVFQDTTFFYDFNLKLDTEPTNRLNGLNYQTLSEEDRQKLDFRPIRTITIRQIKPEDKTVTYEIFSRLNSGGINLKPQEIRSSLYSSNFMTMLTKLNLNHEWRRLTTTYPDPRMRDIEILLRGFAMLIEGDNYASPMVKFLNNFSNTAKNYSDKEIDYLKSLFEEFMKSCANLSDDAFKINEQFNISLYEAVFVTLCKSAYQNRNTVIPPLDIHKLEKLKFDSDFRSTIEKHTTSNEKVKERIEIAKEILL